MVTITMDDDHYIELFTDLGYPEITDEDLPYDETYIKGIFVWKAMKKFFEKFPKKEKVELNTSGTFELDFPRVTTFSVKALFNNTVPNQLSLGNDPFVNSQNMRVDNPLGGRFTYGMEQAYWSEKAYLKSVKNIEGSYHIDVDRSARKVKGYSTLLGTFVLTWLDFSMDFNDIPFNKQDDVIDLAKGYMMKAFGSYIKMQSIDLPNDLDGDSIKDDGETYIADTLDRWKKMPNSHAMRN